jgi:hypothetical protein
MEKTKDTVSWKTNWRIDKFKDQTGTIAKALTHGMPLKQAQTQFKPRICGTEQLASNIASTKDYRTHRIYRA